MILSDQAISQLIRSRLFLNMIKVIVVFFGALFFGSGCKPAEQTTRNFDPPAQWPTVNKTERQLREEFDKAASLDAIEGIWTVVQSGTWRNVASGMTGSLPQNNTYRIAVYRDSSRVNYDFVAVILESAHPAWYVGRVKAYFRKTSYDRAYEALWYMGDYAEQKHNYLIDDAGLVKSHDVTRDPDNQYIEVTSETTLLKAYPPMSGRSLQNTGTDPKTTGSGFLISTSGMVATNYHIVQDASRIEVVFPERNTVKVASVKLRDTKNDLAILELTDFHISAIADTTIPYSFASANTVKVGQEVFTLGFPLGSILGTKSRLSAGRFSIASTE